MNHKALIQQEFEKVARKWNDLTLEEQKAYLKRHPASKRRLTAKPRSKILTKSEELKRKMPSQRIKERRTKVKLDEMRGVARFHDHLSRLEKLADKNSLNRQKLVWVLNNALKSKRPSGGKPRTYGMYDWGKNKEVAKKLDVVVNKIADAVNDMDDRHYGANKAAKEWINNHFYVERNVSGKKTPKSIKEIRESKPKKSKVVKKSKTPEHVTTGDRVSFSSRKGHIEGTITDVRHGNKYIKYLVETDDGQHWWVKRRESGYAHAGMKYLGKTSEKDAKRLQTNRQEFDQALQHEKHERTLDGREKLEQLGVQRGDTVTIKGTRYNWTAKVMDIDYHKGGVRIDQERTRRQRGSWFSDVPGKVTTHYRFIPARFIISSRREEI